MCKKFNSYNPLLIRLSAYVAPGDSLARSTHNTRNPSKLVISGLQGLDLFCLTNGLIGISDVKKHFATSMKIAEDPTLNATESKENGRFFYHQLPL